MNTASKKFSKLYYPHQPLKESPLTKLSVYTVKSVCEEITNHKGSLAHTNHKGPTKSHCTTQKESLIVYVMSSAARYRPQHRVKLMMLSN